MSKLDLYNLFFPLGHFGSGKTFLFLSTCFYSDDLEEVLLGNSYLNCQSLDV